MKEKIIKYLKQEEGFISGEKLSNDLNISRTAVWKYIQELRKAGYRIDAVSNRGYKIISMPDRIFDYEIQHQLDTKIFGKKVVCFETVDTTMDIAFKMAVEGAEEGLAVVAEAQKKGKGRLGRNWVSPKGKGIYMSIILRPKMSHTDVPQLTLLSAVVLREAVEKVLGLQCDIKWPNDILVKDKKLAGILTELSADMDQIKFVVVGIGLNVNTPIGLLPKGSTSIKNEIRKNVSRNELIKEILRIFEQRYFEISSKGFSGLISKWKEYSSTLNRRIKIVEPNQEIIGKAIDLDESGALVIKTDVGKVIKKMTGDVIYM